MKLVIGVTAALILSAAASLGCDDDSYECPIFHCCKKIPLPRLDTNHYCNLYVPSSVGFQFCRNCTDIAGGDIGLAACAAKGVIQGAVGKPGFTPAQTIYGGCTPDKCVKID